MDRAGRRALPGVPPGRGADLSGAVLSDQPPGLSDQRPRGDRRGRVDRVRARRRWPLRALTRGQRVDRRDPRRRPRPRRHRRRLRHVRARFPHGRHPGPAQRDVVRQRGRADRPRHRQRHERGARRAVPGGARLPLDVPHAVLVPVGGRRPVPSRRDGPAGATRPRDDRRARRLRGVGQPVHRRVRRVEGGLRLRRGQRPGQRGSQPLGRAAGSDHDGGLPGRPHGARAAVPPRHGHPRRRRRRVRAHDRRAGGRPSPPARPPPRRLRRDRRLARRGPDPRTAPSRPARRGRVPPVAQRRVDRRHRRVLPLRRVHDHHAGVDREQRLVRAR